nr:NADH dehydrogenase subunit 2 [Monoclona rufilatera]
MVKNSSMMIFLFTLILGTMISISSNSWLGCWMGLEINLLSFIPLMVKSNNLMSTEASLKYFLTQAFASSLLLFSIVVFMIYYNFTFQFNLLNNFNISFMIFITLLIKSGTAPFHFWFPNVMEGINWINNLILMTWQKIAPMMMISYFLFNNFFMFFIISSVLIGSLGGLNQTSLRKIMAFSSINHLGWMLAAMIFNEYMWLFYFIVYFFLSFILILIFNMFKIFYLNQMFSLFIHSYMLKFMFLISLLSLGGLPPFLGFLPKWFVIQSMISINQYYIVIFMICMSLITLYFYLRICYSAFLLNYEEVNWPNKLYFNNNMFNLISLFLMISIFGMTLFLSLIYIFS